MDGFNKVVKCIIILLCLLIPVGVHAQDKGKVAVLPFMVQSLEPMNDLKVGLQGMFSSVMAEKGYPVISPDEVNQLPSASSDSLATPDIISIGKELEADWVIRGSLTKVGEKRSLDRKVTDVKAVNAPFSIFMIEDGMDRLAEALEKSAASMDNRISGISRISSIQVMGNRRVETDPILAITESQKGDIIDQDR